MASKFLGCFSSSDGTLWRGDSLVGTGLRALRPTELAEVGGVKGGRVATCWLTTILPGGENFNPSF